MIRLTKKSDHPLQPQASLTLTLDQRVRSRLRVRLDDGREAGLFLERGTALRDGDCLVSDEGLRVGIKAGVETLSLVRCEDPLLLARACYHLGNRHIALQIQEGRLSYQQDHVLDDMLRRMGLNVCSVQAPFEPEPGAYEGAQHGHSHHSHGD